MSKFDTKQRVDELLFRTYNIVSDAYFWLNFQLKATLKENSQFKNRHAGDRCFVLGTGPSLARMTEPQIRKLSRERTIAVNSFYKVAKLNHVKPLYYSLLDNDYWGVASDAFQEIAKNYTDSPPTIITDVRARSMVPRDIKCIFLYAKHYPVNRMRFDITGNLSGAMNVVSFSILCAIYMGFREIYLLGCDYNSFCSRSGAHSYDDSQEIEELPQYSLGFYLRYYHLTTEFHYGIARLSKEINVKIFNASEGSLLDAYPTIPIELVL
jgi:hypothetical protein